MFLTTSTCLSWVKVNKKKAKLILCIGLLALYIFIIFMGHSVCLIYSLIGFPCPSCGLTRANLYLVCLMFPEAFSMHPLVIPADVLLSYIGIKHIILRRKPRMWETVFYLFAILMFAFVYGHRFQNCFPVSPPFQFNGDALIPRIYNCLQALTGHWPSDT